jgi:glycosyltransferase involved in cell wall biosynthesis
MKLSIIIPVYNEKDASVPIIQRVLSVKMDAVTSELVVVDDGSTDGTVEILKRLKLYEVPITYSWRDYHEGEKNTWRDGMTAIWTL